MSGIQLILLISVGFLSLYFTLQLKKRILDILILMVMLTAAAVFILWPDITNAIAKRLGVGRGADLIFYLSILIFWFVILKLYARIRKIEQQFTGLVRQDALNHAKDQSAEKDKPQ